MFSDVFSAFDKRSRRSNFLTGAKVQARIVSALMIREAVDRYGHENLGFFWVIGEPLLLTTGVMALWSFTHVSHDASVGVVPFALTGYSMLTLWRQIVFRSLHGMRYGAALTFHANVKYLDILLARSLLETVGIMAAFVVAYLPLYLLGALPLPNDPLLLFGGWLLMAWFCAGFGLLIAALTELSDILERFIHPVMYLTLPLTGAFYMVDWMPLKIQKYLLMSPLVHGIEMFRAGVFPPSVVTHYDPYFLALCALLTTGIGFPLMLYAQRHVEL